MAKQVDVAVIGGGAAGLCAAITAAENGAQVALVESSDRVGTKILATGNGRCNLTNMGVSPTFYNAPSFVAPILERFGAFEIRDWFSEHGLLTTVERENRVYPLSYSANSVLDVLRASCERAGVAIGCGTAVTSIEPVRSSGANRQLWAIGSDGQEILRARSVVVASGGGTDLLAGCGHAIRPFQPVLCALETETKPIRGLNGVRIRGLVSLMRPDGVKSFGETGEVLFRDYGVSGVVIFNASRFAQPGSLVAIDLMPFMRESNLESLLQKRCKYAHDYQELMVGVFHTQVNRALLRAAGCKLSVPPDAEGIKRLVRVIKNFSLKVKGPANVKNAQVTRGGAALGEFEASTLASKLAPGLYAAGECLDIDAACGGFNLHWAWSSGIVAGENAARYDSPRD